MAGRIAWSRSGFLAYINDTNTVRVTWLRCVDGSSWKYVPPIQISVASEAPPVMLTWSSSNYDLAIVDELGRVQIVSINGSGPPVNQIIASGVRDQRQRPVELDRVVAMHWLGLEKNLIVPQATQTEDAPAAKAWNSVKPLGPFHPRKGRGALVCVNGNGMLRLLVQAPDHRYVEVDTLIPGAHSVVHALLAPNSAESLLVMLIGEAGALQVYEVHLTWNIENLESKQDFINVDIHPIAIVPLSGMPASDVRTLASYRMVGSSELVICAVSRTAITRYSLSLGSESLHPSFFELYGKPEQVQPSSHQVWTISDPSVEVHETPIQWFLISELLVYIIYENGKVQTESLVPGVSNTRLDTLQLVFPSAEMAGITDIYLSPTTTCAAVYYKDARSEPAIVRVDIHGSVDQEQMRNIARSLATAYAYTVFNSEQCDDLIDVCCRVLGNPQIQTHSSLFFETLASEAQRLLAVSLSPPEDNRTFERFIVIPSPLQRWLSFLLTLGTSAGWHRTPGCRLALCLLNLQLLNFSLTWTLKRIQRRSKATTAEQLRLEITASNYHVNAMLGPVRWATDLIARISQELYDASVASDPPPGLAYRDSASAYAFTESPNVYASLIFASISRFLLRYFLRGVHTLTTSAKSLAEQENRLNNNLASTLQAGDGAADEIRARLSSLSHFAAAQTLRKLVVQLKSAPVQFDKFEKLLAAVDEKVKALVAEAKVPEQVRQTMDAELIKLAKPPSFFVPLVEPLMESVRTVLLPTLDVPEFYFADTSWLGLDEEQPTVPLDAIRKRIILPGEAVQQCTRCGMQSVAAPEQGKSLVAQWSVLFQRHCLCGGSFIRVNPEQIGNGSRHGIEMSRPPDS